MEHHCDKYVLTRACRAAEQCFNGSRSTLSSRVAQTFWPPRSSGLMPTEANCHDNMVGDIEPLFADRPKASVRPGSICGRIVFNNSNSRRNPRSELRRTAMRGRPFPKGRSGNPGGRPRVAGELRALARRHAPEAIEELARLAVKAKIAAVYSSGRGLGFTKTTSIPLTRSASSSLSPARNCVALPYPRSSSSRHKHLVKLWPKFKQSQASRCIKILRTKGTSNYVELLTCLQTPD
jgi:hypothetical protein